MSTLTLPQATTKPRAAANPLATPRRSAWRRLRAAFDGSLYRPGNDGYDQVRQALNPALDPRPAIVAEALGSSDVRAAVTVAREHDLPFAVQSTGHGTQVPCHGGLLIKTSQLAAVVVDPDRRVARVGAGARWGDVVAAAAPFGLAPISGSSGSVGVAGYTFGGGLGWLSRRYGFAADSLLRAEVVTADGRVVTASARRHPDLYWALRGGGGNFGIATRLEIRLHPAAELYGGTAYYPIDRAADTLARYRDWAASQPDQLTTVVVLLSAEATAGLPEPVRGRPVLGIRGLHVGGPPGEAERLLRPLRQAAGDRPLLDTFAPMRYDQVTSIGSVAPRHVDLFRELPDAAIEDLPGEANAAEVRYWGGAMADPRHPEPGPTGHRDTPYSVIADGASASLQPLATGGSFLNFLHDQTRTHTAYTPANYRRLAAVKRAYDPDNVLGLSHNLPPAPARQWRPGRPAPAPPAVRGTA
jgi:hypothetical protein